MAEAGNGFGASVVFDGTLAAAGAPTEDVDSLRDRGAVYILERMPSGALAHTAKLTGEGQLDNFGRSVALAGDLLLVGAPNHDGMPTVHEPGAAYLYKRAAGAWQPIQKLRASTSNTFGAFGRAVALGSDIAFIAAPEQPDTTSLTINEAGAVFVFEPDIDGVWRETAILRASDPQDEGHFGDALAVKGGTLLVGLGFDSVVTGGEVPGPGGAYIFENTGGAWTEVTKLSPSDPESGSRMGLSVALEGTTSLVAAPAHSGPGGIMQAGAVYEYASAGGWHEAGKLFSTDEEAYDYFGAQVALAGDRLLVSATLEDGPDGQHIGAGAVYEFAMTSAGWVQAAKHYASDLPQGSTFGHHMALTGTRALIVGNYADNGLRSAIYVFDCE